MNDENLFDPVVADEVERLKNNPSPSAEFEEMVQKDIEAYYKQKDIKEKDSKQLVEEFWKDKGLG